VKIIGKIVHTSTSYVQASDTDNRLIGKKEKRGHFEHFNSDKIFRREKKNKV
jgi:hypothetical protein